MKAFCSRSAVFYNPGLLWLFLWRPPGAVDSAQCNHVVARLPCDWLPVSCSLRSSAGLSYVLGGSPRSVTPQATGLHPLTGPQLLLAASSPPFILASSTVFSDAKAEQLADYRAWQCDHQLSAGHRPGPEATCRQRSSGARSRRPTGPGRGAEHGEAVQEVRPLSQVWRSVPL